MLQEAEDGIDTEGIPETPRGGGGEEAPEGIMKNLIIFIGIIIYLEGGNHCVHCSQAHVAVREVGTGVSISGEGTTVQRLSNWCKAHS